MWNWLKRLFWGCDHKWVTDEKMTESCWAVGGWRRQAVIYSLRCEKCGDIRKRRVGV